MAASPENGYAAIRLLGCGQKSGIRLVFREAFERNLGRPGSSPALTMLLCKSEYSRARPGKAAERENREAARPTGPAEKRKRTRRALLAAAVLALGAGLRAADEAGAKQVDDGGQSATTGEVGDGTVQMEAFQVTASRESAGKAEGPEPVDHYDSTQIDDSGAFTLDEFFDTLPPGADGDEQLVLIDGQPAYIDPSMLALGMIESVDVSLEGSMPQYGARANGRVINIHLKKDYSGMENSARARASDAGGGAQYDAKVAGGLLRGRAQMTYSLEYSRAEALRASDRAYSENQDHRTRGGSDLRLEWGTPAVIEAVDGSLDALTAGGSVVAAALVPEGAENTPGATDFTPADPSLGAGAKGQRRFDTASYRLLSAPSERIGGALGYAFRVTPEFNASVSLSYRETRSDGEGAPPVTEASADTVVPAAYSPFGEAVEVGMVHVGFGPTRKEKDTKRVQLGLKLAGPLAGTWRWHGGMGYQRDASVEKATDLDQAGFAASLTSPDPAMRFNPFVDPAVSGVNQAIYRQLTVLRGRNQSSESYRLDLSSDGDLFAAPGGPVHLSLRGRASERDWERNSVNVSAIDENSATDESRSTYSGSGSVSVPVVANANARPGLRRLEGELSYDYEAENDGGWQREAGGGLVWAPTTWLSLRGRHSDEIESSSPTVDLRSDDLNGETFIDPRRGSTVASDVRVTLREITAVAPERSGRTSFGATLEPEFLPGLRFSARYNLRRRTDLFRDQFDPQDVINNEAAFAGRVMRADPTPEDIALGQPGRIIEVDTTGGNAGGAESRDIDLSLDYRPLEGPLGRFRFSADARRVLSSTYEIRPGQPFVNQGGSRFNPPDWRVRASASWSRKGWTASLRLKHTGAVATEIVDDVLPAYTEFDLNAGYRWQEAIWGRFGRGTRVMLGVDNLLDRQPPWADTIDGYRGGSPLGRVINASVSVPL